MVELRSRNAFGRVFTGQVPTTTRSARMRKFRTVERQSPPAQVFMPTIRPDLLHHEAECRKDSRSRPAPASRFSGTALIGRGLLAYARGRLLCVQSACAHSVRVRQTQAPPATPAGHQHQATKRGCGRLAHSMVTAAPRTRFPLPEGRIARTMRCPSSSTALVNLQPRRPPTLRNLAVSPRQPAPAPVLAQLPVSRGRARPCRCFERRSRSASI